MSEGPGGGIMDGGMLASEAVGFVLQEGGKGEGLLQELEGEVIGLLAKKGMVEGKGEVGRIRMGSRNKGFKKSI